MYHYRYKQLFRFFTALFLWIPPTLFYLHRLEELLFPHRHGLDTEKIFDTQFQVYILTHDCGRFTSEIVSRFNSVLLVPDVFNSAHCQAINQTQLHLSVDPGDNRDALYRNKYAAVLEHCAHEEKLRCLIVEDDILFIQHPPVMRAMFAKYTLMLFGHETDAYDCAKRGTVLFYTEPEFVGSQCRVYPQHSSHCMSQCIQKNDATRHAFLDYRLGECQSTCGLNQKKILLTQITGKHSIMNRNGEKSLHEQKEHQSFDIASKKIENDLAEPLSSEKSNIANRR